MMESVPHSSRRTAVSLAEFKETVLEGKPGAAQSERRKGLETFLGGRQAWSIFLPLFDYSTLLIALASLSSLWLGEPLSGFFREEKFISTNAYIATILLTIVIANGYRPKEYFRRLGFAAEFVLSTIVGAAIGLFVIYALFPGSLRVAQESRAVLILGATAFLIPGAAVRIGLARMREEIGGRRPFLVIGPSTDNERFSETYHRTGLPNPLVFFDPGTNPEDGTISSEVARHSCEGIVLTAPISQLPANIQEWLFHVHSETLPVHTVRCFYAAMWRQSPVLDITPDWIFEQDFRLAERSSYRFVKRIFDLVFATILLAFMLPLMVLTAILIKIDSRGPVFFCQDRVGRRQQVFRLIKFRTMHEREESGSLYTAVNDPRVTRIGRALRKLRVDELPQLINIWRGDMSLIGPRPEWKVLVDMYERQIPGYHLRHLVSPGITGWAQLNHPYGESVEDTLEKLKFDLYYIQFYSPVLDLEIVLKTIVSIVLLRGR